MTKPTNEGYDGTTGVDADECVVPTVDGQAVVFESYETNPNGTSYVRFIDSELNELLYYVVDEWQESPEEVMGCIMAAIQNGADRQFDRNRSNAKTD